MADQVRVDHMQGFRTFAQGMLETKEALRTIRLHRHLDLPQHQAIPLADMSGEFNNLRGTSSAAVGRVHDFTLQGEPRLSGLAFAATYILTNFTETEQTTADRLRVAELGREAEDNMPPVPPPVEGADPQDQVAPAETLQQRQQRLGMPAQPGQPG